MSAPGRPSGGGERVDRPHVLVLAPGDLTVDVPADEAVDVDERVAVDDHAADRLTDGAERAAGGIGRRDLDPFDPPVLLVARHRPLAGGEADGLAVTAEETVGDGVVAGGPGVRHGEEGVLGRRRTGDVGGLAGPGLGTGSPGPVAHGQAVDLDALAVERDVAGDAPELVEVVGRAERRADGRQRLGRHHAVEAEAQLDPLAVVVAEVVGLRGLDDADRHAGGQHDVAQVGVGGQRERREVGAVADVPREPGRVVPHPGAAGDGADVRADHRVQPPAEPAVGGVEREPRRLGLPPAIAQLGRVEAVVVRAEDATGRSHHQ